MIPNFRWPRAFRAPDKKVLSDVKEHGCHLMSVFGDEDHPEFTYSIGLFLNFGQPEIIVIGLPGDTAGRMINSVRDLVQTGTRFDEGSTSTDILEDLSVTFASVDPKQYQDHLGFALWFYRSLPEAFPCLQLVWPDKSGLFPWQHGFDPSLRALQPLLGGVA